MVVMNEQENAGWSLEVLLVRDIPVRIHYSFFLLPLFVLWKNHGMSRDIPMDLTLFLLVCVSIGLHELGHALAARAYQVELKDITQYILYPFGGIATMTRQLGPKADLVTSAAGPAASMGVVLALLPVILSADFPGQIFFVQLAIGNLLLVILNIIPVIPLDGGRMLQASLQLLGLPRASIITARVSQILSAVLILLGLYYSQILLALMALLMFTLASREFMQEKTVRAIAGLKVTDIMVDRANIETLSHGMSVADAVTCIMKSFQDYFPVMHADTVVGLVHREDLLRAAASGENSNYIAEYMVRDFVTAMPGEELRNIISKLSFRTGYPILVFSGEEFAGMLLQDAVAELLFLEGFRDRRVETEPAE